MANPFSSNPFESNLFSSGAGNAPGEAAPSSSSSASGNRRSTHLGPDEVAPGQFPGTRSTEFAEDESPMGTGTQHGSFYRDTGDRRSTHIGPDEIVPSHNAPPLPNHSIPESSPSTSYTDDWRLSTLSNIQTEDRPYERSGSIFSSPDYSSSAPGNRGETGTNQLPFSSPNYSSSGPGDRRSTKLDPYEVTELSQSGFADPDYGSTITGHRKSTKLGPYEVPASSHSAFSDPVYEPSGAAKRKSTKVGPYEVPSSNSPFSKPNYRSSASANRKSTKVGPDELQLNNSPFSSPNYKSAASSSRLSTRIAPDEFSNSQSHFSSPNYKSLAANNRKSMKVAPEELGQSIPPVASLPSRANRLSRNFGQDEPVPAWKRKFKNNNRASTHINPDDLIPLPDQTAVSRTPGDRRSTHISPDEMMATNFGRSEPPSRFNPLTGGIPEDADPFSKAPEPFATIPESNSSSPNPADDGGSSIRQSSATSRKSVNFSKRIASELGALEETRDDSPSAETEELSVQVPVEKSKVLDMDRAASTPDVPAKTTDALDASRATSMADTPLQTPAKDTFRTASGSAEMKTPRTSRPRPQSVAFNLSPPTTDSFSQMASGRRSSTVDSVSQMASGRRSSTVDSVSQTASGRRASIIESISQMASGRRASTVDTNSQMPPNRRTSTAESISQMASDNRASAYESLTRGGSTSDNRASAYESLTREGSTADNRASAYASLTTGAGRRQSSVGGAGGRRQSSVGGAGGRRPSSMSITNVVIPSHLLTHVETSWNQDKIVGRRKSAYQREDSRRSFNIQAMAQQQQEEVKEIIAHATDGRQFASESMEALSQANPFAVARARRASVDPRRKSMGLALAAVSESEKFGGDHDEEVQAEEKEATEGAEPEGLTPFGKFSFGQKTEAVSPSASFDPDDPMAAAGKSMDADGATATGSTSARPARRRSLFRQSYYGDVDPHDMRQRRSTIFQRAGSVFQDTIIQVKKKVRRSSLWDVYENAKKRQLELRRKRWVQLTFEYTFYAILVAIVYFLVIGVPLWKGAYWELYLAFRYKLNVAGSWSVVIAVAVAYSYSPLFVLFEPDPPMPEEPIDPTKTPNVQDTALMIPCYKAAGLIGPTLEAATKVFPPENIFVVANGNSPTPLDDTEEVCRPYGVNHIWSPVGSKIVAQFVGCYAAKDFKNVLLIDDDCALPPNFPIVSDRLKGRVMCMGYTIKSVGPESSSGTLCQQAQDLEYKISGIQRALAGKIGSATFPHGAISLWDREFLIKTFNKHPGFSVSEDWFFGHVARQLGCRTQMATSVFIETETPPAVFFSSGGSRGGFGEMTVFKQRFMRWNFFFVNGMYYNMHYIFCSWNLGWWELGTKLFVFQEVYETLLYLATPLVVPVSLVVRPSFFFELLALTFGLYMLNAIIFNEVHLRRKKERVPWKCVYLYYMPYKLVLTFVNVASCYWAIYKYATYFANRHPKIIEDEKAINVVLQLEEEEFEDDAALPVGGRRMSVTAIGSQVEIPGGIAGGRRMTLTAMGQRFSNPDITVTEADEDDEEPVPKPQERRASITMLKSGETPVPSEGRRPSITIDGRTVSIGSAAANGEASTPATRRGSDASQTNGTAGTSFSEPSQPRANGGNATTAAAPRKRMSMAKRASFMLEPVVQEEEEPEEEEQSPAASRRASKRYSNVRASWIGPVVEEDVPEVPIVTPALMNRLRAIENALNARGIGAVDFAITDDTAAEDLADVLEETDEETHDETSSSSSNSSSSQDEKKHPDARSMV